MDDVVEQLAGALMLSAAVKEALPVDLAAEARWAQIMRRADQRRKPVWIVRSKESPNG